MMMTMMRAKDDAPRRRNGAVRCAIFAKAVLNMTRSPLEVALVGKLVKSLCFTNKLRRRGRIGQPKLDQRPPGRGPVGITVNTNLIQNRIRRRVQDGRAAQGYPQGPLPPRPYLVPLKLIRL